VSRFVFCYAECHYAECRYAECRNVECRGTLISAINFEAVKPFNSPTKINYKFR